MIPKQINPGEYWYVNYKNHNKKRAYKGIVLVKLKCKYNTGYSCIIAKSDGMKTYVNEYSGSLFVTKDFVKKTTQKNFLLSRAAFLEKEMNKTLKKARKCKN